jgi:hypothetical protein
MVSPLAEFRQYMHFFGCKDSDTPTSIPSREEENIAVVSAASVSFEPPLYG